MEITVKTAQQLRLTEEEFESMGFRAAPTNTSLVPAGLIVSNK